MNEAMIEVAARELCKLRGKDPDGDSHGYPHWERAASEIRAELQLRQAIAIAEKPLGGTVVGNGGGSHQSTFPQVKPISRYPASE